jgi:hypothetical protein
VSEVERTFGLELRSIASIEDGLALEATTDRGRQFLSVDSLLKELLESALQGVRVAKLIRDDVRGAQVSILILKESSQDLLNEMFAVHRQQSRGAWYLPDSVSLKLGLANLVAHFQAQPRFALGIVSEERASVALSTSPDVLCLWALVERFFDLLSAGRRRSGRWHVPGGLRIYGNPLQGTSATRQTSGQRCTAASRIECTTTTRARRRGR